MARLLTLVVVAVALALSGLLMSASNAFAAEAHEAVEPPLNTVEEGTVSSQADEPLPAAKDTEEGTLPPADTDEPGDGTAPAPENPGGQPVDPLPAPPPGPGPATEPVLDPAIPVNDSGDNVPVVPPAFDPPPVVAEPVLPIVEPSIPAPVQEPAPPTELIDPETDPSVTEPVVDPNIPIAAPVVEAPPVEDPAPVEPVAEPPVDPIVPETPVDPPLDETTPPTAPASPAEEQADQDPTPADPAEEIDSTVPDHGNPPPANDEGSSSPPTAETADGAAEPQTTTQDFEEAPHHTLLANLDNHEVVALVRAGIVPEAVLGVFTPPAAPVPATSAPAHRAATQGGVTSTLAAGDSGSSPHGGSGAASAALLGDRPNAPPAFRALQVSIANPVRFSIAYPPLIPPA